MDTPLQELCTALEAFSGLPGCRIEIVESATCGGEHSHHHWEVLLYRRSLAVGIEKALVIPPGVVHSPMHVGVFSKGAIFSLHHGYFECSCSLQNLAGFRGDSQLIELMVLDLEQLRLCRLANLGDNIFHRHFRMLAEDLMVALNTFAGKILEPRRCDRFNFAAGYIVSNSRRASLSLAEVATHIGISVNHLSRLFRNNTGMTARHFLILVRLSRACELIRDGSWFINDIAAMTGWSSHSHFAKMFRRHLGMTPGEFARHCNAGRIRTRSGIDKLFPLNLIRLRDSLIGTTGNGDGRIG